MSYGGLFLVTGISIFFLLTIGFFDSIVNLSWIRLTTLRVYIFFASLITIVGIWHLIDWWRLRKGIEINKMILLFPREEKNVKVSIFRRLFLGVGTILLAFLLTFMASFWQQNYYLFLVYYYSLSLRKLAWGLVSFFLYVIAYSWPLILTLFIFMWCLRKERLQNNLRFLSLQKIFLSAFFISVAAGFFYYFKTLS